MHRSARLGPRHHRAALNLDVKYAKLGSDVKLAANGAKVSAVQLDPMLIGVGVGYRF
ncbi:OmpW family outer membrane protein [Geothrix sp. 21YS21S-2]|uniref:OmpW family outer membrane protein n=1 Tax=Geothrix sp. 21YS21S-2 TaxID=3068893 RepID=UPI0027B89491|nr:OmpW family outer membrane protein [Geothrix sp. 21YS21S-2]